jgi:hypothetical protein
MASANAANTISSLLRGKIALPESLGSLESVYRNARPFPHLVLDNVFPAQLLEEVIEEIPEPTEANWVRFSDEHVQQFNLRCAVILGKSGSELTALLHSALFLYFLSELTGIWNLLPDPYLQGAGYHRIPVGGKFDVHVDRNTAYDLGLMRRLALMIYLNKDWNHEYGGQLELWDSSAKRCEASIEPVFNRIVIFEIADRNFHGVPAPVACPEGRSRNSFVAYYHTAADNGDRNTAPHSSIYAPNFYNRRSSALRRVFRDVTPPVLLRGAKRLWRSRK